jgi:hypothetical protein
VLPQTPFSTPSRADLHEIHKPWLAAPWIRIRNHTNKNKVILHPCSLRCQMDHQELSFPALVLHLSSSLRFRELYIFWFRCALLWLGPMAAQEYYLGSPSPTFSPYGQQHSVGPWQQPPSPQFYDNSSPTSPAYFGAPGNPQNEPFIYEYESGAPRQRGLLRSFPSFIYNWWLCILSVFVSLCAIAAIVALLLLVDGQTLPRLPLSITVNTYVSFFATVAKGTMLVAVNESISQLKWLWFREPRTLQDIQVFDDASRGPIGAVRLIFRTRASLVALGSVVAILSLVMDPFAQQIVSYPERSIYTNSATVGRAQAYDAGIPLISRKRLLFLDSTICKPIMKVRS